MQTGRKKNEDEVIGISGQPGMSAEMMLT